MIDSLIMIHGSFLAFSLAGNPRREVRLGCEGGA